MAERIEANSRIKIEVEVKSGRLLIHIDNALIYEGAVGDPKETFERTLARGAMEIAATPKSGGEGVVRVSVRGPSSSDWTLRSRLRVATYTEVNLEVES